MTPLDFPEANMTYTKPASMTDEECKPLRVFQNNSGAFSCWQMTQEERMQAFFFGYVWLHCRGGQPLVSLMTGKTIFGSEAEVAEQNKIALNLLVQRKVDKFLSMRNNILSAKRERLINEQELKLILRDLLFDVFTSNEETATVKT